MSECPQCDSDDTTAVSSNNSDSNRVSQYLCGECWHMFQVVGA